ncbi:MAG: hypothetical protein WCO56_06715 [Verrucomicrobiota bacterium]
MNIFEITGWDLSTSAAGTTRLLELLSLLSGGADRLCVEAHFLDFESMEAVAAKLPSPRFALYGWGKIADDSCFSRKDFRLIQSARILFGLQSLTVIPDEQMPGYDWHGNPSGSFGVTYAERNQEPVQVGAQKPDAMMVALISEMAVRVVGPVAKVTTSTTMTGDYREHAYTVSVPSVLVIPFVQVLSQQLGLRNGIGSFEFLGTTESIKSVYASEYYAFTEFPNNCWSWNGGVGKTTFALERASYLRPVFNTDAIQLTAIASIIDSLGSRIARYSVIRKYLSWNLTSGATSPRTQGNFAMLSKQKAGYAILLGYEQYADEDPPVKLFKKAIEPIVKCMGGELKRVQYIK